MEVGGTASTASMVCERSRFLVILFHVRAPRMSAGFIGVDILRPVGYLITSGLVRELRRSNSIDLARFWSRRIRRLMPAAILVILVVLV